MKTKYNHNLAIDTIRMLGISEINKANSGHPGIVLDAAPAMYSLYIDHMKTLPNRFDWINRDRFVLSAGHGSAMLYAGLHLAGFPISMKDLEQFRTINSITPGHPERDIKLGIEATTGPLGQGIAMGVGLAVAETFLAGKFNKQGFDVFDHNTFILCGDGDLEEGVSQEAIALAGHWKLNKLILLYDSNRIQLDTEVKNVWSTNIKAWFESNQWNHIYVHNGMNYSDITMAISEAKKSTSKPTIIELHTEIGYGSSFANTSEAHGKPLGKDIETVRKSLNYKESDFTVPKDVTENFKHNFIERNEKNIGKWDEMFTEYKAKFPNEYKEIEKLMFDKIEIDVNSIEKLNPQKPEATRNSSAKILKEISNINKGILGGSADLTGSTKVEGCDGNYSVHNRTGREIKFGVREFAMAAIANGLALNGGLKPFVSTFLIFSDYLKGALRLSALMKTPNLYVFTHDSVMVGQDGPTHEPIEQLAALRSIPNLYTFRPADFTETLAAYKVALESKNTPSALVFSRQNLPQLNNSDVEKAKHGAYIISEHNKEHKLDATLIATGSEVSTAIEAQKLLNEKSINVNVVSMPCQELFLEQSVKYQSTILPSDVFKVTLEMGSTFGWHRFATNGATIGIDRFGISAPDSEITTFFGFEAAQIATQITKILAENK